MPDRKLLLAAASLGLVFPPAMGAQSASAGAGAVSLTLRQAVDLALKQNPQVRIAKLRTLQADAAADRAKSRLLPQVNLDVNSGYQTLNLRAMGLSIPGLGARTEPFQVFDVRPVFTEELYNPVARKELAASRERAKESQWNAVSVREQILLSVAEAYFGALDSEARIEAGAARLRTAEALHQQARHFVAAGTASVLDESRAAMQVANERRAMTQLEANRDLKKLVLASLLGLSSATRLELTEPFDPPRAQIVDVAVAVADAMEHRPEMRAMRARLSAGEAERQRAKAQRLPTFGLMMDFGQMGNSISNNVSTYTLRGTFRIPILQSGRTEAEIRAADAAVRQVEDEIRSLRLEVERDVYAATVELNAAQQGYTQAAAAAELARKTLELATARFEAGLSNNIEVVNAQEALASSQSEAIRYVFTHYIARARLARVQGNLQALFD